MRSATWDVPTIAEGLTAPARVDLVDSAPCVITDDAGTLFIASLSSKFLGEYHPVGETGEANETRAVMAVCRVCDAEVREGEWGIASRVSQPFSSTLPVDGMHGTSTECEGRLVARIGRACPNLHHPSCVRVPVPVLSLVSRVPASWQVRRQSIIISTGRSESSAKGRLGSR